MHGVLRVQRDSVIVIVYVLTVTKTQAAVTQSKCNLEALNTATGCWRLISKRYLLFLVSFYCRYLLFLSSIVLDRNPQDGAKNKVIGLSD